MSRASRALDLTQRQVRAICEGARKAKHVPILTLGKARIELIPEDQLIHPEKRSEIDEDKDFRL